jgi:hypothetical protein
MSQRRIDDLMQTLRRANAHHSQLAAASRAVSHPARKARKHARALSLSISVEAASTLDHRYVSTIPLPILDSAAPSSPPDVDHANSATINPEIVAPIPRYPSQIVNDRLAQKITRPVLRCVIPSQTIVIVKEDVISSVSGQCTLASQWSASTQGSGETEEGDEDEDIIELDVPQPAQIGVRYPRTNDNENMDILVSPDDEENDETFPPIHFTRHLPLVTLQVPENNHEHSLRLPLPTHIPRQAASVQQQQRRSLSQAAEAGLAYFSSGSDVSRTSLELLTPVSLSSLYTSDASLTSVSIMIRSHLRSSPYQ